MRHGMVYIYKMNDVIVMEMSEKAVIFLMDHFEFHSFSGMDGSLRARRGTELHVAECAVRAALAIQKRRGPKTGIDLRWRADRFLFSVDEWDHCSAFQWEVVYNDERG
jgi:hypothetical protein